MIMLGFMLTGVVSLVALSFWSFHFASICAFGLLAYVGYVVFAFPSLFQLHRLNGLLLVFILLWAVSTYIFNVAFAFLNWKVGKVLNFLVADGGLKMVEVSGSMGAEVVVEDTACGDFRVIFFLVYLLSHNISKKIRQSLVLLCEAHFAILCILQLNLVLDFLERKGSLSMEIITQLGLLERDSSWDFLEMALLACLCAGHNHGSEKLFSFSAIVEHAPFLPVGFGILKAGLNKSVLFFENWLSGKINLSDLGYDTEASLWEKVWESLAIMIVMQLYSYERRHSRYTSMDYPDPLQYGVIGFIKRLLIWHSQKILFVALFYAALSPISAFGFIYLLGIVICSNLPKVPRFLSKSFLIFTGVLVVTEYLFQMFGQQAKMFPGQKHFFVYLLLGFRVFEPGFWGLEAGLRGKVLVIAACTLQYNVFHWRLPFLPSSVIVLAADNALWFKRSSLWNSRARSLSPASSDLEARARSSLVIKPYLPVILFDQRVVHISVDGAWKEGAPKSGLGLTVDDPRVLISYFVVFMLACFKLRADHISGFSLSFTYCQVKSQQKNAFVWRDLSFETKSMWTSLDYLRFYCYCHLLDLVLALILVTGTLEYDILHLGYLAFALVFFRIRLQILKKKKNIFRFLRVYNFAVIVLLLAYQSPFVGGFNDEKCGTIDYIYEKQAAWKKAQLQHIRESEEKKRQRNLQVEKMKAEMLNLQIQLNGINSTATWGDTSPNSEGLRRGSISLYFSRDEQTRGKKEDILTKEELNKDADMLFALELHESPKSVKTESPRTVESRNHLVESPHCEIIELEEDTADIGLINLDIENKGKGHAKDNPIISAVQLLGDGVSQVQSYGNQAVTNLVSFLNIADNESDTNEHSLGEDGVHNDKGNQERRQSLDRSSSLQSDKSRSMSDAASLQIGRIFHHIWSQMHSNNDVQKMVNGFPQWNMILERGEFSSSKRLFLGTNWSERAWKLLELVGNLAKVIISSFSVYWRSLTQGAESPPYFVQLSLDVHLWPEDGIQPERIESAVNQMLRIVHDERCKEKDPNVCHSSSRVHVQSIERSTESSNVALAVFEVVYASPLEECKPVEWYKSLTPAVDVAKEILHAQRASMVEEVGFPYPIVSVIGGAKRELDLYAYVFGADLVVFFLVAIFYQSVIETKVNSLKFTGLKINFLRSLYLF
ncbi:hypothetical protein RHGRI_007720 [Rhododendron griersonianum]|uniref:Piezo-type mechanosensitive ion channel homolog domain-containing protein n=1 Tax=Rhododendron griersonianum TaxID=479676 RepID=A0AAV6KZH3_9ERIC|nr:hypothetical protein RHGRI_007720 [Rhododendron griersonianum]